MTIEKIFFSGSVCFALLVLFAGCGPTNKKITEHAFTSNLDGLVLDKSQAPTILYKRPGAPSLAAYTRFIIDPVRVDYRDPKMREISPKDLRQFQVYFYQSVEKALTEGGYKVGTRTGPGTMRISFTLSGLEAGNMGGATNIGAMAAGAIMKFPMVFALSVGRVTVEGVFREATSNRIDAVAVSSTAGSRMFKKKPWSTWADVRGSFDIWAEGIRKAVDKAHGK
jgi:hypothetical protein